MNETPEKKTSGTPPASLPISKEGTETTNDESAKASPLGMSLEEAYAQMIASAGNMGEKSSLLPDFARGRKTPGAP
jgi:hypothetical protein